MGSPCESVGWHHYIFVAKVFLGPQIGDVEHISSTFLHLILHRHWGTGMPEKLFKVDDKMSNVLGTQKQDAFHPTLIHVILVMLRTARLCRIRQRIGHVHFQVWYADWHILQYG